MLSVFLHFYIQKGPEMGCPGPLSAERKSVPSLEWACTKARGAEHLSVANCKQGGCISQCDGTGRPAGKASKSRQGVGSLCREDFLAGTLQVDVSPLPSPFSSL